MSQPWHLWKKFWRSENSFSIHQQSNQVRKQILYNQSHVLAQLAFASCCPLILCYNQPTHPQPPWPISPWLFLFSHSADYRKYTVGRFPFFSHSLYLFAFYLLICSVCFHLESSWFLNSALCNRGERIVFWWPNTNIIRVPKNDQIRIWILFGFPKLTEYEYYWTL